MIKITVEDIMTKIKEEVNRRKQDNNIDLLESLNCNDLSSNNIGYINIDYFYEEDFIIKKEYEYSDFTKFHGEDFIRNVYLGILKREVDLLGLNHYLQLLCSGKISKSDIITKIRLSKEGKSKNVKIKGLLARTVFFVLKKIPLIKMFINILMLSKKIENMQSYEFYNELKLTEIKNRHLSLIQNVNMKIQEINKVLKLKVNNEKIEEIDQVIQNKADNQKIEEINQILQNKVDNKKMEEINRLLKTKADNEKVKKINEILKSKTEKEELDILYNKISVQIEKITLYKKDLDEFFVSKMRIFEENKKNEKLKQIQKYDEFYVEFENKFRGSIEEIKERQKIYLPYLEKLPFNKTDMKIVDLGCGRGEWLDLLKEKSYTDVTGVDINKIMIKINKDNGNNVIEYDIIEFLKKTPENSVNVITGFHIVEHLGFEKLMELIGEVYRVLKKDGIVIFETPNPENLIVGACNFYTDLTHFNPIPLHTLEFLMGAHNLKIIQKINELSEYQINDEKNMEIKWIIEYFLKSPDYSMIGKKNV